MVNDNDSLRRSLVSKFGTSVNFVAEPGVLKEILSEIAAQRSGVGINVAAVDAYDKTYTEGYNKENYSKGDYSRYDRTVNMDDVLDDIVGELRPEFAKLVLERIRARELPRPSDPSS